MSAVNEIVEAIKAGREALRAIAVEIAKDPDIQILILRGVMGNVATRDDMAKLSDDLNRLKEVVAARDELAKLTDDLAKLTDDFSRLKDAVATKSDLAKLMVDLDELRDDFDRLKGDLVNYATRDDLEKLKGDLIHYIDKRVDGLQ